MIKVLYFANLKETAGTETEQFNAAGQTVAQLKQLIADKYQIKGLDAVMTAVNEEFSDDDTMLSENDTVAFIPPVSGG